ncbi:bifunctional histidinal dehydrogenase and histidinol dehydrogenase [uncultured Alphaproteobacteria bacterium]|uniref:Histidinol dehydrogenase n=1 Tax=uncultured Alphaproteobacteria bacterium TaxID=91750 RepID=A0A212KM30_9PROT|nr:bifunctional histidinal dehydrogenase and histidinol dehydrogenase [uncultured Alphaproteobacteria bacterium]
MPVSLDARAPDFEARFAALLAGKRETAVDVADAVSAILDEVRRDGDAALIRLTAKFDRQELTPATLRVAADEIAAAEAACDPALLEALDLAAARIRSFHEKQLPRDLAYTDAVGARLGLRWTAVDAAGLYVPGGTASYPSSVLMNAIPAKVAGVKRLVMAVPMPGGAVNPLVLAAARRAGVDEIYRVGGAQAVAALAYGTATIRPVDKIVGPGNAYVAAAKRMVFGTVGIDMIAGPSEVLVVADAANDPDWIAVDLLSQAEHDAAAQAILITDDAVFAGKVAAAVEARLRTLPRGNIAAASWRDHGALIVVPSLDAAPALVDRVAPEHLELAIADPDGFAARVRHAGAIFLGRTTPEALGDYVGGPNHVLPTARSARFSSGLGVLDFLKRTTLLGASPEAVRAIGPAAVRLAESEGLTAHALSVSLRLTP